MKYSENGRVCLLKSLHPCVSVEMGSCWKYKSLEVNMQNWWARSEACSLLSFAASLCHFTVILIHIFSADWFTAFDWVLSMLHVIVMDLCVYLISEVKIRSASRHLCVCVCVVCWLWTKCSGLKGKSDRADCHQTHWWLCKFACQKIWSTCVSMFLCIYVHDFIKRCKNKTKKCEY